MFKIESFNVDAEARTFEMSDYVFHEALKTDPVSKERFHVKNPKGEDFDIVYWDNNDDIEPVDAYPSYLKPPYMVKYLKYNEYEKESIYLEFLKGLDTYIFEELNEYTIVLTKVILKYTDMQVWCNDPRILWFIDEDQRLHIADELPSDFYNDKCFYVQEQIRIGMEDNNFNRLSSTYAFHNLFFMQWILDGRSFSDFKYITIPIDNTGGIGAILSSYVRFERAFGKFGLKFVAPSEKNFGKFPRELVERYFAVDIWNPDANKENTLVVPYMVILIKTKFYNNQTASVDTSVIADSFKEEMNEYYDAVFGDKKTLGILIRGTDYIATGLSGTRKMATVEQMIPTIRKWMEDYGYEKLFLATEDNNILKQMKAEFGKTMVALSQERLTVGDLRDGQIISDYEKEHNGDEYNEKLEDTTVNYFYALYILSRCNAFICSGQCNGWDMVLSLNEGKYERKYKFAVGINGDPATEGWRQIRPVTAGMFARGAYPTEKAFFMTYRFDLADKVDPKALKKAWDSTLKVYPYMGYAITIRNSRLVFTENPLPFVIEETGEVIEPFGRKGNFHTVTFCYLGNTLYIYADHVPTDGTGFMKVLETFFYHYYCLADGREYPVPEGVYTEKDGAVLGQEEDAYLAVDPIDPKAMMSGFGKKTGFAFPEAANTGMFVSKADCRAFCLSVPSKEFMEHVKKVGGSPMSVLAVFTSEAMQKAHPENELPLRFMAPVSIRKVMGNENSLLHQVVHAEYEFDPKTLKEESEEKLNAGYRQFLKGFASEQNIKTMCGVYRGICEGYTKAFVYGALDKIITDTRNTMPLSYSVSYLGTLKTGEYGRRIRMTAFHVMQEKGLMLQVTEIADKFYIDWYQGFHGEQYVKALRDILEDADIRGTVIERTE